MMLQNIRVFLHRLAIKSNLLNLFHENWIIAFVVILCKLQTKENGNYIENN